MAKITVDEIFDFPGYRKELVKHNNWFIRVRMKWFLIGFSVCLVIQKIISEVC